MWGPILTSIGSLLTIVLVFISDIIFGGAVETITIWSLLGCGSIVVAFSILAYDMMQRRWLERVLPLGRACSVSDLRRVAQMTREEDAADDQGECNPERNGWILLKQMSNSTNNGKPFLERKSRRTKKGEKRVVYIWMPVKRWCGWLRRRNAW